MPTVQANKSSAVSAQRSVNVAKSMSVRPMTSKMTMSAASLSFDQGQPKGSIFGKVF